MHAYIHYADGHESRKIVVEATPDEWLDVLIDEEELELGSKVLRDALRGVGVYE